MAGPGGACSGSQGVKSTAFQPARSHSGLVQPDDNELHS